MYENDDKTDSASRRHRGAKSVGEATEAIPGECDAAGESVGGMEEAERHCENRVAKRGAKVVSDFRILPETRAKRRGVRQPAAAFLSQPAGAEAFGVPKRGDGVSAKRLALGVAARPSYSPPAGWHAKAAAGCRTPRRFALPTILRTVLTFAFLIILVPNVFAGVESPQFDPADAPPVALIMILMLLGIAIAAFVAVLGFMLAIFAAGCSALLVAIGIVSSAVMIGVLRRRVSSGLRAFHYMLCAAIAAPATVGVVLLARTIIPIKLSTAQLCVFGSISGMLGGLFLAGYLDIVARIVRRRFSPPTSTQ